MATSLFFGFAHLTLADGLGAWPDLILPRGQISWNEIEASNRGNAEVVEAKITQSSTVVAQVDERYLSFSIDSAFLIGAPFWKEGSLEKEWGSGSHKTQALDLENPSLVQALRSLGPAYLRIGGSEADRIFYNMQSEGETKTIPPGYSSVLTLDTWSRLQTLLTVTKTDLVFTLNAGLGPRNPQTRIWQEEPARQLIEKLSPELRGRTVWELGNELNIFWFLHGLKAQISPDQYKKDLGSLANLVRRSSPGSRVLIQGSAFWPLLGESLGWASGLLPEIFQTESQDFDLVNWHYYPQQSTRAPVVSRKAYPGTLLEPKNLDEAARWADQMARWRTQFSPGKNLWLGETGHAQFGGEPGVSDTLFSSFWFLDQLGLLARHGVSLQIRQSLVGGDYGLLSSRDFSTRPDYWAAWLWKHTMGREVLTPFSDRSTLRVYTHRGPLGQGWVLINLDTHKSVLLQGLPTGPRQQALVEGQGFPPKMITINSTRPVFPGEVKDLFISGQGDLVLKPLSYAFLLYPDPTRHSKE